MAQFLAGQLLTAQSLNDVFTAAVVDVQSTGGTTTSTTYTTTLAGGTACGVAFTAPASGKVRIENSAFMDSTSGRIALSFQVREGSSIGSGTVTLAVVDDQWLALHAAAGHDVTAGISHFLSGLTPGATYNVQQFYKISAGTATFQFKKLAVYPITD